MYILPLADAKELVGKVSDTEINRLDVLTQLISGRVEQVLNRTLARLSGEDAVFTEIFHGGRNGRGYLSLRAYPNITDVTIYDDTMRVFGIGTEISASDYYVEDNSGLVYMMPGHTLMPGIGNIKVTYNGGYPVDKTGVLQLSKDHPIRLACELQLRFMWQRRDTVGTNIISHTQSGTISYNKIELLPDVKSILYNERRWNIGM